MTPTKTTKTTKTKATSAPNKPVEKMNVYELRDTISDILREEFADRLAELEHRLGTLFRELEKRESKPPRSDFFDLRLLILKENQSKYNRINNTEAIGALWCALKLQHVGQPDEMTLSCRRGDEYDGHVVIHISSVVIADFPEKVTTLCSEVFKGVHTFEFFLKLKNPTDEQYCDTTEAALMMTARAKMHDAILEIEEVKLELQSKIDTNLRLLKNILREDIETRADSDAEVSDEDDDYLDEDGHAKKPSPKRSKTYGEMGTTADTWRQHVSNFGIQISPGKGVKNTRIREFRGGDKEDEFHFVELCGAMATGKRNVYEKKLPRPIAPTFSHGAEDDGSSKFKLLHAGQDLNSNTSVTQKMMDVDAETGSNLVGEYESMHRLARSLRQKMCDLVKMYNSEFDFVIRAKLDEPTRSNVDYHVNHLSYMQKIAIGQLYMDGIAVKKNGNTDEADEPDGEESDGDEESSDDDESDSGSEYEPEDGEGSDGEESDGEESDDEESDDEE